VERIRQPLGMTALIDLPFNSFLGGLSVTFFFVLSGFLITTLLLTEKTETGTIRIRRFLTKRARRIWPLYYLVLAAGYGISILVFRDTPANPFENGLVLNALLLPNVAFAFGLIPNILIQIWSIGTEEQFYLIWPFLLRRMQEKNLPRIFLGIICFWLVARIVSRLLGISDDWLNILLFRTRIDCMAIGAFAALLLLYRERGIEKWAGVSRLIYHPVTGWIASLGFLVLLVLSYRYHVSLYQLYAVLSAILILRVIRRPAGWLESGLLRYLGKISYGIYLLQHFVIIFLFKAWIEKSWTPPFTGLAGSRIGGISIFLLAVVLTTGLAALSYTFFESRFLKRKV
jgi:peptidoglycan/LPS O-acetylase OafA/YrhL